MLARAMDMQKHVATKKRRKSKNNAQNAAHDQARSAGLDIGTFDTFAEIAGLSTYDAGRVQYLTLRYACPVARRSQHCQKRAT